MTDDPQFQTLVFDEKFLNSQAGQIQFLIQFGKRQLLTSFRKKFSRCNEKIFN